MSSIDVPLRKGGFGSTTRKDTWWIEPLLVFLGFSAFIVYSTWAALQGDHYTFGPYLSPFYSPLLMTEKPIWWPAFLPFSAAMLILWAPGGFRLTCYYYRGAYYKAFWQDPPSCTVGEPRKSYWGERSFPLILQNIHRYFLYLALVFIVLLSIDCHQGNVLFTQRRRREDLRHRRGDAGDDHQSDSARCLHTRMPLPAASRRRAPGYDFESAGAQDGLRLRVVSESPPYDVGVVQPVLGRIYGCLHPVMFDGDHHRLEDPLGCRITSNMSSTFW